MHKNKLKFTRTTNTWWWRRIIITRLYPINTLHQDRSNRYSIYTMGESVVLIVFTTIIFILLFTSFQAVKFYIDPRFNDYLTTIISSICLMLVLSSIFLIPIDVYLAQSRNAVLAVDAVLGIYHFVFILLLMLYFIVLPFAYFYYDSPTDWSSRKKMNSASKYTFLSIS